MTQTQGLVYIKSFRSNPSTIESHNLSGGGVITIPKKYIFKLFEIKVSFSMSQAPYKFIPNIVDKGVKEARMLFSNFKICRFCI